ncbi:MAG: hypothetical protein ACOCUI_04300 [bacterium]
MFNNILTANEGQNIVQGRLMNFELNDLIIRVEDGATDDISSIDDLDAVVVNARLKRGNTKLILNSMRLSDIFKISNALGGYAFDKSDDQLVARVPVGNIKLSGQEVLEVEIQNSGSFTDLEIKVSALNNHSGYESIRTYEGINSGGDNQNFNNTLSIFAMDNYDGSATINDGDNSYQITASETETIANSIFEVESYVNELGLVYTDKTQNGKSITAKLPEANYVVVGRL